MSGDIAIVAIADLVAEDSPRLSGENAAHIRRLADSVDPFPPLLVHRQTLRVVDGMHRLYAARLRGQTEIEVRYVDGDDASIFVLAVQANVTHGLPLTLADRKAAAARIIGMYPEWSDRMVASVAGISAKTAADIRRRLTGDNEHLDRRVGRDGKARPVDGGPGRALAARLLSEHPEYSLRAVARAAGISPETARRVRAAMRPDVSGQGTAPDAADGSRPIAPPTAQLGEGPAEGDAWIRALRADPGVRGNEQGRMLLRMLSDSMALDERGGQLVADSPSHCLPWMERAAIACSVAWQDFAEYIHHRQAGGSVREWRTRG